MNSLCPWLFGKKYCVQAFPPITKKTNQPQNEQGHPQNLLQFQHYELGNNEGLNVFRPSFAPETIQTQDFDKSDIEITPTKPQQNQIGSMALIASPGNPTKAANHSGQTLDTPTKTQLNLHNSNRSVPSLKSIESAKEQKTKITPQQYYNKIQRVVIQLTASSLTQLIPDKNIETNQRVYKRIEKSEYDSLIENYKEGKWEDASFVKQKTFETSRNYFDLKWKHFDQIFAGKKIVLFEDGVRTTDIVQGQIGDCYFLSAVAALARNPERILALFPQDKINPNGIFMTRMIFKGIKKEVTVDSYLPVFINKDKQSQLLGCKPNTNSCEIYTMILEKCWAKLWRSYEKIHGGYPHQALHALTGAVTKNYLLSEQTSNPTKNKAFFNRALNFQKREFVMCAGTGNSIPMAEQKTTKEFVDIQSSHIYCVENVIMKNGEKMVKIYNPWGHNYIKHTNSNKKIQTSGHAWLTWQEFTKEFMYLTVCKVYDNAHYLYEEMDFKPRELKLIELTIHDKTASYLSVTVSQTDKKEEANVYNPYLNLTYIVVKEVKEEKGNYALLAVKNSSKFSEHYMELVDLQPGKYLIAIYISNPEIKEKLTFAVYSQATFGFAEKKTDSSYKNSFIHTVMHAYDKQLQSASTKNGTVNDSRINVGLKGDAWISFNMMINKSCFGYLLGHVDNKAITLNCRLGRKQLNEAGIRVLPPFDKEQSILMQVMPGNESFIVFVIDDFNKYLRHQFKTLKDFHRYFGLKPEIIRHS